ncbi:MAG: hypothetical protein V2B15_14520 [Bacteroidota bacterium]
MKNRKLTIDPDFVPLPADDGNEFYLNGIFKFNITKISQYILSNPGLFIAEEMAVKEIHTKSSHINESHLDSVDISKPVILAEIAPGRYNLIDGNHRVEKAFRLGIEKICAFRIHPEHHQEKERISYVYDFGDDWHHEIILEETFPNGTGFDKPLCSDGAMHCPPEDCGGIPGYQKFIHNLNQPNSKNIREIWSITGGSPFDPEWFDRTMVNKLLKRKSNIPT